MNSNEIGIVVIGRNEGQRLVNCLASLKCSPYRVVYVDSGSADGSASVAAGVGAYVVRLDAARPFTAARARNEGFAALKEICPFIRFVQFIDGDCEIDGGWLEIAIAFLERHPEVAIVCGRRRELFPEKSIYNALADVEWSTTCGETASCGGDSMIRAEAFTGVGGFRDDLIAGEEPELCARLRQEGWKIWRLDAEMTRHDINMTRFSQWWRRTVRCGYGYAEISRLTRRTPWRLYRREIISPILWGGVFPVGLAVVAFFHPLALALVLIYPLQVIRIACRRGPQKRISWYYSISMVIGRFAEFEGVSKFYWTLVSGLSFRRIDYKGSETFTPTRE